MLKKTHFVRAAMLLILVLGASGYTFSSTNCGTAFHHPSLLFSFFNSPTSGQAEYKAYCVGCHGQDGRGKGHSSAYCTVPPANLTQIAQRNNGVYQIEKVCDILRRGTGRPARGQGYMPIWEPLLKSMNADPPDVIKIRIQNLAEFVKTLQEDSTASKKHPSPHQ